MLVLFPQKCNKCGGEWEVGSDSPPINRECPYCETKHIVKLYEKLTPEVKAEIDEMIYARQILQGMKQIKQLLQIQLRQSNELFTKRYKELRESHPNKFVCSDQAYWDGFYS